MAGALPRDPPGSTVKPRRATLLAVLLGATGAWAQDPWLREADRARARRERARAEHLAFVATLPPGVIGPGEQPVEVGWREAMRREALAAVERSLAAQPDEPHALGLAATLRERLGDPRGALRDADRALALAPEGPEAPDLHFVRALAHTHLGAHERTRDEYLAALRFPMPDDTRGIVLGNLADAWLVLGDTARAVETYREGLRFTPDYALGWLGLAIAQDRDGADPTEAAAEAVRRASRRGSAPDAILEETRREGVFFVPPFDRYTYEAMAHEALARMYAPGGELGHDPLRAQQHRVYARFAWEAWGAQAPADDRWRPRVARHLRALATAVLPQIPRAR